MITMQILSHNDRAFRTGHSPHGGNEVTISVIDSVDDHRPMHVQQHAINRPCENIRLQLMQEVVLQRFVSFANYHSAGIGERPEQWDEIKFVLRRSVNKAACTNVGARETVDDFLTVEETKPGFEVLERCRFLDKSAGLVRDPSDRNSSSPDSQFSSSNLKFDVTMGNPWIIN